MGKRLAMRDGKGFARQPFSAAAELELVDEPRLSYPGLAHDADDLPPACFRELERSPKLAHLRLPADKPNEAPPCRSLEPRAERADPRHFVDRNRLGHSLDLGFAERLELEISVREVACLVADQDRS